MIKVMYTDYGGEDSYIMKSGLNIRVLNAKQFLDIVTKPHHATYTILDLNEAVMDDLPPAMEIDFCEMYDAIVYNNGPVEKFLPVYEEIWKWLEGRDD